MSDSVKLTTQPTLFRSQHGDVLEYYEGCSNKANLIREALVYYVRNVIFSGQSKISTPAVPAVRTKLTLTPKTETPVSTEEDVQTMEAAFGGMFKNRFQ